MRANVLRVCMKYVRSEEDASKKLGLSGRIQQDGATKGSEPIEMPQDTILQLNLPIVSNRGMNDPKVGINDDFPNTGFACFINPRCQVIKNVLDAIRNRLGLPHVIGIPIGHVGKNERGLGLCDGR